jgi:alpha-D-xyloside xylohydrolase
MLCFWAALSASGPFCGAGQANHDQVGGHVLAGAHPHFINTTDDAACCAVCQATPGCDTWVRQPSTSYCFAVRSPESTEARADRTVGVLAPAPTPAPAPPTLVVEQYGADSLRIRAGLFRAAGQPGRPFEGLPGAILANPLPRPENRTTDGFGTAAAAALPPLANGNIVARFAANGALEVFRVSDGALLIALDSLQLRATAEPGYHSWNASFRGWAGERVWGLGERMTGQLDNKGQKIDFRADQTNTHVTIPFALSSRQYGLFWNHPGWGGVELGAAATRWSADMARQIDILVVTSSSSSSSSSSLPATAAAAASAAAAPAAAAAAAATTTTAASPYADITGRYYDAIGHAPRLPDWALGLWASKQRYASQAEILGAVRNYTAVHGIDVDVLVIDWKHYECVGDWDFTLDRGVCWPDPAAMVAALRGMGVAQVFVSVHPWSQPGSVTHDAMVANNLCIRDETGNPLEWGGWTLPTCKAPASNSSSSSSSSSFGNCLYDPSNPAARAFLWDRLHSTYYAGNITNFWTDGTEPAGSPEDGGKLLPPNVRFMVDGGPETVPAPAAFMMWPVWHSKTAFEGAAAAGGESWSLARSAWAGSHLHKTIVWSGDIQSDWQTLSDQVRAGLNMQLTYPFWNSDTGGFKNGDWPTMGDLVARWFQFSIFTTIVRLHGSRNPKMPQDVPFGKQCDPTGAAGGPIEPWVYGDATLTAIKAALGLRKKLLPYIRTQVAALSDAGVPIMRPLWFDFAADPLAAGVEDQFMYGPGYMVAPVLEQNATTRRVYFPAGASYTDYFTAQVHAGGTNVTVPVTSLQTFPFFVVVKDL